MNIKEKFGQMIMLGLDIDTINDEIISLIKDYKIGGVVLYKKNYHDISSMKDLINKLKEINAIIFHYLLLLTKKMAELIVYQAK